MTIAAQWRRLRDTLPEWMRPRGTRYQGASTTKSARLHRKRIFVLPTRPGLVFITVLAVMLLGATNYSNNMAFALTFLLGGVVLITIFHTYNNLRGLEIKTGAAEECFVGRQAVFTLLLSDPEGRDHFDILVWSDTSTPTHTTVNGGDTAHAQLAIPARRRGSLTPGRVIVASAYPMGLFRAWAYIDIETQVLVYPKPIGYQRPTTQISSAGEGRPTNEPGSDDFHGFRSYAVGDSPRHINWKAYAAERGLVSKQFHRHQSPEMWLDWQETGQGDIEIRLSRMCRWVLDAEQRGHRYGLRMPGVEIQPDRGEAHQRNCLRHLALFGAGQ